MPELPEVETVAEDLRQSNILDIPIIQVEVFWMRIISSCTAEFFIKHLIRKKFQSITRRGKFLIFTLDRDWQLLVHLKMSGRFFLKDKNEQRSKHEHIVLTFENGLSLRFHDTRKFGRFFLTDEPDKILKKLGPDPIQDKFELKEFTRKIHSKKKQLKYLLLDQTFLAGLGNIYVDESLWLAKIHPCRPADSLSMDECKQLYHAIKNTLNDGLKNKGTSLGQGSANFHNLKGQGGSNQQHLKVYGRQGLPCGRCNQILFKSVLGQRGTHFCPRCQSIDSTT